MIRLMLANISVTITPGFTDRQPKIEQRGSVHEAQDVRCIPIPRSQVMSKIP
jgi:hypothetical protein